MNETFYIKKFSYINSSDVDISFVPMLIRRKLSLIDKISIKTISEVFEPDIDEIIFASQYGSIDKMKSIIKQYSEDNEVSPFAFSSSVHNYFVGLFSLINKITTPYNALAAGENSLSAGLINAIISNKKKVIFCYADNYDNPKSVACLISKEKIDNSIEYRFLKENKLENNNEFENFIPFLEGKTKYFSTFIGKIERVEK